jgi:hypothetical protein
MQLILPAAAEPPAGGAEIVQVVIATALVGAVLAPLAVMVARHRAGRPTLLGRAAAVGERLTGLPGWAALPSIISAAALITALFGMYWDISLHIDQGRDAGPLANPAHYPILFGLIGVFVAGWLAVALPRDEQPGPAPVRLAPGWETPVGGVLIAVCGGFALLGFPLDDMWHRLFGQDVTLWGPTHLMMLGGAAMTLIGQAVLLREGMWVRRRTRGDRSAPPLVTQIRRVALMAGLLLGLSIFQAEFDFGVPQFRMVFQPMLIALAAGFALIAARIWVGRGGALAAVAIFLAVRGAMALLVGPVLGQTTPMLPLYLGEALCVELAALALGRERPLALGLVAGALVGTVGFASEWAWSQFAIPLPWTGGLLPEGLVFAFAAGIAGGVLGGLLGAGLRGALPSRSTARGAFAAAAVTLAALTWIGLSTGVPRDARATLTADERPGGTAVVEATVTPASLIDDAAWANVTSWQGGGLEIAELGRVGDDTWRTTTAVPVSGDWKTTLRVQRGSDLVATPVYLPEDAAIPAAAVPAPDEATRGFVADKELLQREVKDDVPGWLWTLASGAVLAMYVCFLLALAWGVGRVARAGGRPPSDAPTPTPAARGAVPASA